MLHIDKELKGMVTKGMVTKDIEKELNVLSDALFSLGDVVGTCTRACNLHRSDCCAVRVAARKRG